MLEPVPHPLDGATLQEVFDYAARRLADASEAAGEPREFRLAVDRFDEAYMWMVAALPPPILTEIRNEGRSNIVGAGECP